MSWISLVRFKAYEAGLAGKPVRTRVLWRVAVRAETVVLIETLRKDRSLWLGSVKRITAA